MAEIKEKKEMALDRLREIGIKVEEEPDFYDFKAPRDLNRPRFIELGYLLACLAAHEFPTNFTSLCDLPSKMDDEAKGDSPVEFVESYPDFLLYRVYKKK